VTPRQADAFTAVAIAGLLLTAALTSPRWSSLLRPVAGADDSGDPAGSETDRETEALPSAAQDPARRISVRLYFEAKEKDGLLAEEREVAFASDLSDQIRIVVEELVKGPAGDLVATLPPATRVEDVFVLARGVACVNLSGDPALGLPGGSRSELLTVYSIVNTIVANFPAVSRVQLVLNSQLSSSFGGHVDLTRPLPADMTLLALDPPPLAAAGAEEAPKP
jgi:spore germination protein GerM